MSKKSGWLKKFFFPPPDSSRITRVLPYIVVIFLVFLVVIFTTSSWEYTNTTEFCGTTCHTMPPQYVTHQLSSHARVTCEDCHLGRAPLITQIGRKIEYSWQTGSAMVANSYEYPIRAKNMRPANDACETCHYPQQFSSDTLVELKRYGEDKENSLSLTYLILKTGGGSKREGLGFGIHWHIENPVKFVALDPEKQIIPYVRVENEDGTITEYVDVESNFDPTAVIEAELYTMDCITCHNRTSHEINQPDDAVNEFIGRGEISVEIPEIRKKSVEVLTVGYATQEEALAAIDGLRAYYQQIYPDYTADNPEAINKAIQVLQKYYQDSVFTDQKMDWNTHPDNAQHLDSPGCFRCHDGKHLTQQGEAVRLECNLCHSVPVVTSGKAIVADIQISRGVEPESHKSSNWISLHRESFDQTCKSCHTVEDPGGTSNTSFCSNSGCHGTKWEYAGFDAPALRLILSEELKKYTTPTPGAAPTAEPGKPLTYESIQSIFGKCTACHGSGGIKGVNLSTYADIMKGGEDGPIVIPGDAEASLIVQVQQGEQPHFGQFDSGELEQLINWITDGALEK